MDPHQSSLELVSTHTDYPLEERGSNHEKTVAAVESEIFEISHEELGEELLRAGSQGLRVQILRRRPGYGDRPGFFSVRFVRKIILGKRT